MKSALTRMQEESHSEEEETTPAAAGTTAEGQAAAEKKKKKKKKKKSKSAQTDKAAAAAPVPPAVPAAEEATVAAAAREEHNSALSDPRVLRDVMATMARLAAAADPKSKEHKFWHTQPVPRLGTSSCDDCLVARPLLASLFLTRADEKPTLPAGPIEGPKQVLKDSLSLPDGFTWVTLDIDHERTVRLGVCRACGGRVGACVRAYMCVWVDK
jgi:hypothetical protein